MAEITLFELTKTLNNLLHNDYTVNDYKLCKEEADTIISVLQEKKKLIDIESCGFPRVVIEGNYCGSKTFPSLNNLLAEYGKHPKAGNTMKGKFQRICNDEIRMQLPNYKASNPVILHYRYFEPQDGHYRDFPNIHSFCSKVFCDALQDCKVIPNDNPRFLLNETHDFFYLPEKWGEPYIEIYIEEVKEGV